MLPATHLIDFKQLKTALKVKRVSLAREAEIKRAFPDVEVGAMPPFGGLYGVGVIVYESLTDGKELVCNAGSHTHTMTLAPADLLRAERPIVATFGAPVVHKPVKPTKKSTKPAKSAKKPKRPAKSAKPSAKRAKPAKRSRR